MQFFTIDFTDLTVYDTVKQIILRNTRLEDNIFTHILARCSTCVVCHTLCHLCVCCGDFNTVNAVPVQG